MLGYRRKYKTAHDVINMLKEAQKQKVTDDYSCGLYNGIELCLAAMEEREPELVTYEKEEPEVIEKQEQTGRTLFSGERRLGQ